jgi:signal transduction histidine kinase/ActR/RegA family two-component response regulator
MNPLPRNLPLATALVHRIFVVYLALAVILTLIQINIEYRNTYSAILNEIDASAHAFEPSVSDAVWNFQKPFLDSIVQGMVNGGTITGVDIDDVYKRLKVTLFKENNRFDAFNISKSIPLFHTYSDDTRVSIGSMTVYSNHAIVIERVKFGILLILIASVIKTAGLWFIIIFFVNRLLAKPLGQFTEQIKSFDLAQATRAPSIDLGSAPSKELVDLRETFCELAEKTIANKQLIVQKEAAEEANLAKSRFLAAASHDLRQPMHAMNLYLASLTELDAPRPIQAWTDNLKKCAKAMNDMLDTLLDISSIDAGAMRPHFSTFPIMSVLDRMQVEFDPLARAKGLTLCIVRCSALVYTDEEIVERMLRNLISNAVRYTQRGKILIGCRRRGTHLRVMVYDTGIGIDPGKQQAIFEEYYQIDNQERNRAKGLGLGLAIVQRFSKLLGTSIIVNSKSGIGSQFAFDLPCVDLETIQPIAPPLPAATKYQPLMDIMILVIDDDPLILDATRILLKHWGCTVITANDAHEARRQLTDKALFPDVILCDYLLAENENGVSVIAQLRATFGQDIPAILITGDTLPEHIEAMRATGLPILHKPLDQDKLRTALSSFISWNYVEQRTCY